MQWWIGGTVAGSQSLPDDIYRASRRYSLGDVGEFNKWGTPLLAAATYQTTLTDTQASALHESLMTDPLSTTDYTDYDRSGTIQIVEDAAEYPQIIVTGYLKDYSLENVTTGEVLNYSGTSLSSRTSMDAAQGALRVIPGTTNVIRLTASEYDQFGSGTIIYDNYVRYSEV